MTESSEIDKPDWLNPSTDVEAPSQAQDTTSDAKDGEAFELEKQTSPSDENGINKSQTSTSGLARCKSYCACGFSTIVFAAFVYATVVQENDIDRFKWSTFYGLHAAVPALFVAHYFFGRCCCGFAGKVVLGIYVLCVGMAIWSIVYIVLTSLELKELLGSNNPNPDKKEELIFELSGASLGFVSATYHLALTRYLAAKKAKNQNNG